MDLTGQRFGRLVVVSLAPKTNKNIVYNCKCDCGKEKIITKGSLTSGDTKSCGCLSRELSGLRLRKGEAKETVFQGLLFKPCSDKLFSTSKCGKVLGRSGKLLKPRSQGKYLTVAYLKPDGKYANKYVHRLVAEAWVINDDPSDYKEVNHKDGNRFNNAAENLEWVNRQLNVDHAIATGLTWNFPKKGEQGFQKKK